PPSAPPRSCAAAVRATHTRPTPTSTPAPRCSTWDAARRRCPTSSAPRGWSRTSATRAWRCLATAPACADVRPLELRLLGPIEVGGERGPIELAAPRQRALLALLLLRANVAVGADRLADELWDSSPPPSARKALQVHVVALRRALGAERIVTQGSGYLLRAGE